MTTSRTLLIAAYTTATLAAALATAGEASARGRPGGPAGGPHAGHHQLHVQLQQLRHRHHQHGSLFSRFTPCVVWTRQGWTNLCSVMR